MSVASSVLLSFRKRKSAGNSILTLLPAKFNSMLLKTNQQNTAKSMIFLHKIKREVMTAVINRSTSRVVQFLLAKVPNYQQSKLYHSNRLN